jgi:hypothetical protein
MLSTKHLQVTYGNTSIHRKGYNISILDHLTWVSAEEKMHLRYFCLVIGSWPELSTSRCLNMPPLTQRELKTPFAPPDGSLTTMART